jgi:hypothetical protein
METGRGHTRGMPWSLFAATTVVTGVSSVRVVFTVWRKTIDWKLVFPRPIRVGFTWRWTASLMLRLLRSTVSSENRGAEKDSTLPSKCSHMLLFFVTHARSELGLHERKYLLYLSRNRHWRAGRWACLLQPGTGYKVRAASASRANTPRWGLRY